MSTVDLPNIREPFLAANGQISRPWWLWLQQLMTRIGGSDTPVDLGAIILAIAAARSDITILERLSNEIPGAADIADIRDYLGWIVGRLEAITPAHGQWSDPDMHDPASQSAAGFMSAADKTKLDGIPTLSAFSAYQNSVQAIGASTFTTITFDTEVFDDLGEYNPATGTFTAAATGKYAFNATVQGTQAAATNRAIDLYVNGASRIRMQQSLVNTGNSVMGGGSGVVSLTAGDAVTARYFTGIAENTTTGSNITTFSGWRIK